MGSPAPDEQHGVDPVSALVALLLLSERFLVSDVFVGAHLTLFILVEPTPAPLNPLSLQVALLLLTGFLFVRSVILRRTGEVVLGVVSQPLPGVEIGSPFGTAETPAGTPAPTEAGRSGQ